MTTPTPDDPVEHIVRNHLDREAAKVDAASMLHRVRAGKAEPALGSRWLQWAGGAVVGAAIAAGIAFLFITGSGPEPKQVAAKETATEIIEKARTAHSAPTDRCYEVTAEWDPAPLRKVKLEPLVKRSKLWTRGDQFWIETIAPDGHAVAWGQAKDGRIWVTPTRKRGLIYDASEVGEPIAKYCDLMSLRIVATLGELLESNELARQDDGQPGEPIRIAATLRPTPANPFPRFRQVELELDPETKVIRSAVLKRLLNGEVVGTLAFKLIETADLPANSYEAAGHLDADAILMDGRPAPRPQVPLRPDPRAKVRDEFLKRMQERIR